MPFKPAEIAADGTMTFRNDNGEGIAYAANVYFVAQLFWERQWTAYGSPTQADGYFLIIADGYDPAEFDVDPGEEDWREMTAEDLDEFCS